MFTPMISSMLPWILICVSETHDTFSNLREVVLVPNHHWGGEGLLGCVFGCVFICHLMVAGNNTTLFRFGYLHRIPPRQTDRRPLGALPEKSEFEDHQFFVPTDVSLNTAVLSRTSDHGRLPRVSSPMVAQPHPTRAREMTHHVGNAQSTSRPGTPRRSTHTPRPSSQSPVTSHSFGSTLNGDSSPQS